MNVISSLSWLYDWLVNPASITIGKSIYTTFSLFHFSNPSIIVIVYPCRDLKNIYIKWHLSKVRIYKFFYLFPYSYYILILYLWFIYYIYFVSICYESK